MQKNSSGVDLLGKLGIVFLDKINQEIQKNKTQETKNVFTPSDEGLDQEIPPMQHISLNELQDGNFADFVQSLTQHRFWHIDAQVIVPSRFAVQKVPHVVPHTGLRLWRRACPQDLVPTRVVVVGELGLGVDGAAVALYVQ